MGDEYARADRLASFLKTEIACLIQQELSDPHLPMVTVTGAKVSPDLSYAKIYIVAHESKDKKIAIEIIKKATKFIRHHLAKRLSLRKIPELHFFYDESLEYGCRISKLLEGGDA